MQCILFRTLKIKGKSLSTLKVVILWEKHRYILGTELWGSHYEELLCIVKSFIIDIWVGCFGTGLLQY